MVSVAQSQIKMIEALRIKKYIGYYIFQNRNKDFDTFVQNAVAPIEHMFNGHSFCDPSWCSSKEIEEKVHNMLSSKICSEVSSKFIRTKQSKKNI